MEDDTNNAGNRAAAANNNNNLFSILPPPDPSMQLSSQELTRALRIREAIQDDSRIRDGEVSDFMVVQYALTSGSTTAENDNEATLLLQQICQRVYLMQCFRDEYRIHDTVQEGVDLFGRFTLQHPGLFLAMEFLPASQSCLSVHDFAAFWPAEQIRTDDHVRVHFGGSYYLFHALSPNFRAIREGWTHIVECEGADTRILDAQFMEKTGHHLFSSYPKNQKDVYFLNSPTVVNVWWSLWKHFMPRQQQQRHHLGHSIEGLEGHRIDALYKTPTAEAGRQRLLFNIQNMLQLRRKNESEFSLIMAAMTQVLNTPT